MSITFPNMNGVVVAPVVDVIEEQTTLPPGRVLQVLLLDVYVMRQLLGQRVRRPHGVGGPVPGHGVVVAERVHPDAQERRARLGDDDAAAQAVARLTAKRQRVTSQRVKRLQHNNICVKVNATVICK